MLSKLAVLILGILGEKERNPYDIIKLLKELDSKKVMPIADSTVYATIKTLEKKDLIKGRVDRSGNLPEKTIYKITEKGDDTLKNTVAAFLYEPGTTFTNFDAGVLLMHNLKKPEIMKGLKQKMETLESEQHDLKKQILELEHQSKKVAFTSIAMLKNRRHMIEAELKTVKELIKELNQTRISSKATPFEEKIS